MSDVLFTPTLAGAFEQVGLPYPGEAEPGRIKRFSTNGGKRDAAGWLKIFPDGDGAVFGCWREGATAYTWQRKREGQQLSRIEIDALREKAAHARAQAQAERQAEYDKAAAKADRTWQAAAQATAHPYLSAKGIQAHTARTSGDSLVVPVYDDAGSIQSLQTITPSGDKRFMAGGKMAGGRCWIGEPAPSGPVVICEGFATGATIHESTGFAVVVAFNAGNLLAVAQSIRDANPEARIVIAGDDDKATPGNPGRTRATEAAKAVKGIAIFPKCDGSDFNDMAAQSGLEAVAEFVRAALEPPPPRFKLLTRRDLHKLPPMQWRIRDVLPQTGTGLIVGQSQAGKSFVGIDLLARVSLGLPWFEHETEPCKTVYVGLEGLSGLPRRIEAWERHNGQEVPDAFAMVLEPFKLTDGDDIEALAASIIAAGGANGLVVVDTLAQASPGIDENSSADMGRVIEALQTLQRLTGGFVAAVHHMGKDSARGARGHSSLYAAMDTVIGVSMDGESRTLSTDTRHGGKAKDSESITHSFTLERIVLWAGDDGREVVGAAVQPQEGRVSIQLPKAPKGGNARIVWEAIGDALRAAGDARPADAPMELPEGRPAIRLEAAIARLADKLPVDPKRKVERTRQAITSLVNSGLLIHSEGWIWCK